MRRVIVIVLSAMASITAACGSGDIGEPQGAEPTGVPNEASGLLLDEQTETLTRGRLSTVDGLVTFSAVTQEGTTSLTVRLNDKTFEVTIDGSVTIDGHNAVLTVADKTLLLTLADELTRRFATATVVSRGVETLARLASYLSEAPVGYVHRRLVNGTEIQEGVAAAGNGSVICITKGQTYTAVYTNKAGQTVSKSVVAGSNWGKNAAGTSGDYSCMGRCGGGCTGFGSSTYSKDCLNHDTCSHDMNSSGGGSDTHGCADEYSRASDDLGGGCTSRQ